MEGAQQQQDEHFLFAFSAEGGYFKFRFEKEPPFPRPEDDFFPIAADGGLICFKSRTTCRLRADDPPQRHFLTVWDSGFRSGVYNRLPAMRSEDGFKPHYAVGLIKEKSPRSGYKVVVVNFDEERAEVFSSDTDLWRETSRMPEGIGRMKGDRKPTLCNGRLYFCLKEAGFFKLVVYDPEDDAWRVAALPRLEEKLIGMKEPFLLSQGNRRLMLLYLHQNGRTLYLEDLRASKPVHEHVIPEVNEMYCVNRNEQVLLRLKRGNSGELALYDLSNSHRTTPNILSLNSAFTSYYAVLC